MNYKKHVITGFKTEVKYTNVLIKNLVSQKSKVQSAEMQAVGLAIWVVFEVVGITCYFHMSRA